MCFARISTKKSKLKTQVLILNINFNTECEFPQVMKLVTEAWSALSMELK